MNGTVRFSEEGPFADERLGEAEGDEYAEVDEHRSRTVTVCGVSKHLEGNCFRLVSAGVVASLRTITRTLQPRDCQIEFT